VTHTNNVSILLKQTPSLLVLGHEPGNSPHAILVVLKHKQSHTHVASIHMLDPFFRRHYIPQTLLSPMEGQHKSKSEPFLQFLKALFTLFRLVNIKKGKLKLEMTPPSLLIQKSIATQFFIADF